jgi:choline dehydrogenase-like flavoprotein
VGARDRPESTLLVQLSGVGGSTNHYQGNSPRAAPGAFVDYTGADRNGYDTAHLFPFGYRELIPFYEWVEATLPVETAPMGLREQYFFQGA